MGSLPPSLHLPYMAGDFEVEEVDRRLITREFKFQLLNYHLARAQQRMIDQANKHRTDMQFKEGDWVYVKIQLYRQLTMSQHHFNKLSAKYYGPYMVEQKVGSVEYKLVLPTELMLHPTFHVSLLKACYEVPTQISHPLVLNLASLYCPQLKVVLDRRMIQKGGKVVAQLLIQWD